MFLNDPLNKIFHQLKNLLSHLENPVYTKPCNRLSNATIGHHVRHIIELFQCLENGYETSIVNYEKRNREYRIESDKEFALEILEGIFKALEKPNKDLVLEAKDYYSELETVTVPTNYYRELVYNLEHTIHHMALIRVGITEVSTIQLPEEFGVAYSTVKYRRQCAQ